MESVSASEHTEGLYIDPSSILHLGLGKPDVFAMAPIVHSNPVLLPYQACD